MNDMVLIAHSRRHITRHLTHFRLFIRYSTADSGVNHIVKRNAAAFVTRLYPVIFVGGPPPQA